jgi:hypothetical protein
MDDLNAAIRNDMIWLRTAFTTPDPDIRLLKLPLQKTLLLDEDDNLFVTGSLTPIDKLPELSWQPIQSFVTVEVPVSLPLATTKEKVNIELEPCSKEQHGVALLTSLFAWKVYAETALQTRLKPLRFAVSENENVLIIGAPLPPLPGSEYWLNENLLLPGGYNFKIPVLAKLMSQKLHTDNDIILLDTKGSWQRIPAMYFIPATRSAIRLTQVKTNNG